MSKRESCDFKRIFKLRGNFRVEVCKIEEERVVTSQSSHEMQMRESTRQGARKLKVSHCLQVG
jgi:hypothetical protein